MTFQFFQLTLRDFIIVFSLWRFSSVTRVGRPDWTAWLWRLGSFLEGGHIYAFLWRYFISFVLIVRPANFLFDLLFFRALLYREFYTIIGNLLTLWTLYRLTEPKWREKMVGTENPERSDGEREDRPGRPASYTTGSTQVISYRISIFLIFWFETCFIYTGTWRQGREDSSRGWPLYAQMSAKDSTTELAEPFHGRSAPRVGSGGNDYGTLTPKCESPVKLRSGRASKVAEGNAVTQSNSAR